MKFNPTFEQYNFIRSIFGAKKTTKTKLVEQNKIERDEEIQEKDL